MLSNSLKYLTQCKNMSVNLSYNYVGLEGTWVLSGSLESLQNICELELNLQNTNIK